MTHDDNGFMDEIEDVAGSAWNHTNGTGTNMLNVPEIRNYRQRPIEGGIVITYEVRQPGEADWQPVTFFKSTE